jgi:hypothetical protein
MSNDDLPVILPTPKSDSQPGLFVRAAADGNKIRACRESKRPGNFEEARLCEEAP